MTPRQIELVESSFQKVAPIADVAAQIFYTRLFEIDPSLRPMFKSDLKTQGKKLMDMLRLVVTNLRNLERILPVLRTLGERHNTYGVKKQDYVTVGSALIDTLHAGLGDDFTSDVCEAWLAAYSALSQVMSEAAEEQELQIA